MPEVLYLVLHRLKSSVFVTLTITNLLAIFTFIMKKTELEQLIEVSVQDALSQVGMGKAYRWKEAIMQAVQGALYSRADMIDSQIQLEGAIDEEVQKIREDLDMTLEMIARSLYQVPFSVFKMPKPPER